MVRFFGIVLALMVMFSAGQAYADCTNPASPPGQIYYNTTQRIFQYCSDTVWKRMNINPGTGSGGCTNPTTPEGQMVYNEDSRLLQGCAGNVFRPFTAPAAALSAPAGAWFPTVGMPKTPMPAGLETIIHYGAGALTVQANWAWVPRQISRSRPNSMTAGVSYRLAVPIPAASSRTTACGAGAITAHGTVGDNSGIMMDPAHSKILL